MQVKSFSLKDGGVDIDARTFEGYASTWDKDLVGDIIMPGAFTKSINEAFPAKRIKVLWNHGEPIGMPIEMREDERGLFVKGKISKTARGDEVLELIRDSLVDTMSIGFTIPAGKSELSGDVRIIREVRLMEFSPVTFAVPARAHIPIAYTFGGKVKRFNRRTPTFATCASVCSQRLKIWRILASP